MQMLTLYRPAQSGAFHISTDDLGDLSASVLAGGAVVFSPATCVLSARQCSTLALAARAAEAFRHGGALPPSVTVVDGLPPEDDTDDEAMVIADLAEVARAENGGEVGRG